MEEILLKQELFFNSYQTFDVSFRKAMLKKLRQMILKNEDDIYHALELDLGKSNFESYMCEVGLALSELTYMEKYVRTFSKAKTVRTPISQFLSHSYTLPSPYGNVLIISPWNYPFLLSLGPMIDAIAAGNTVILKPSEYSVHTSSLIHKMISETFDSEYIYVALGDSTVSSSLLDLRFDKIFFTGSKRVGQIVMEKASKHLTDVTLELGGKCPCILDKEVDIRMAARRIVFGKYLNCGQTCVAPDYVLCHESIKDKFIECVKSEISEQYASLSDYGHIINEKHFNRILRIIDFNKVVHGGKYDIGTLTIEPTVMDHVTFEDAIMSEEIFGPVLPILTFTDLDYAIDKINSMPSPLALYMFSNNKQNISKVMNYCQYGGGCINDVVIHLATNYMGFGGVKESGMGSYHGKAGFDCFSHTKSIVDKKTIIDLPMRYSPYTLLHDKLIRFFLK